MEMVSVIIPTYKRLELLPRAIRSVIHQTHQNFEIIVVDDDRDGSAMSTVRAFADDRIRYSGNERNKGAAGSRNTGILKSTGEFIAFLDDDDEWLPDKLDKQISQLRHQPATVGWAYSGYLDVDEVTGKILSEQWREKKGNIYNDLMVENCVGSASTVVIRKECFNAVGMFDETLPCSEDYDLWIRIGKEFEIECVSEPLFKYSIHQSKITTDSGAQARGIELMRQKHKETGISATYFSNAYVDLGIVHCLSGNMKRGRQLFWKSIQVAPFVGRGYANICLSLLGAGCFRGIKQAKSKLSTESNGGIVTRRVG